MKQVLLKHPSDSSDLIRSLATLALAVVQPIAGRLAELTGRGVPISERSRVSQGPTTPAAGAFVIWLPIFLASLAFSLYGLRPEHRNDPLLRRVGWLAGVAYAGNTAWSLLAQFRGLGWPSVATIALSATGACLGLFGAERADRRSPTARLAAHAIGPLAGWLTVASFANLEATLNETSGRPPPETEARRAVGLICAASTTAAAANFGARGNLGYAGAAAWGLGGIIVRNIRNGNRTATIAAAIGLATVATATAVARAVNRR